MISQEIEKAKYELFIDTKAKAITEAILKVMDSV